MGEVVVVVHTSKMLYATLLKALALWEQIRYRREILADMFPDIDTQWQIFLRVIAPGISRKVAVTASLSKSDSVPDETRVPPSIEITSETLRLMHRQAAARNLTLNATDYTWFDEADRFEKAFAAWSAAIGNYLEIEQIANDLAMHRAYAGDMYESSQETRSPGQLTFYNECNIPLSDGIFVGELSRKGLQAGFGALYLGWLMKSIEELVTEAPPVLETSLSEATATPLDDPNNPGVKTRYPFSAPSGWTLLGVVIAVSPDLTAPDSFYTAVLTGDPLAANTAGVWYGSSTDGALYLLGAHDGPAVPESISFKLLLIRSAA